MATTFTKNRGENMDFTFIFINKQTGAIIDVTADTFVFYVKENITDSNAEALISLATTDMTIVSNNVQFSLTPAQMDLPASTYNCALRRTKSGALVSNVILKALIVIKETPA